MEILIEEDKQMADEHIKRCSTLLAIWKAQITDTVRYYHIPN